MIIFYRTDKQKSSKKTTLYGFLKNHDVNWSFEQLKTLLKNDMKVAIRDKNLNRIVLTKNINYRYTI